MLSYSADVGILFFSQYLQITLLTTLRNVGKTPSKQGRKIGGICFKQSIITQLWVTSYPPQQQKLKTTATTTLLLLLLLLQNNRIPRWKAWS